jgi:cysteinyl-tRNA synthetase
MSTKYLGQEFDIHGGGMDLKFPHHECEIAQNVGACGKDPVRYWMHGNMLNFEGQKMSKSLGNAILPIEMVTGNHPLLDKGYSPMTLRLLMLSSHYSSELDITIKGLQDAEKGLSRLHNAANYLDELKPGNGVNNELDAEINSLCDDCKTHMDDDFNTPKLVATLYALTSHINTFYNKEKTAEGIRPETLERLKSTFHGYLFDVLGLRSEELQGKGGEALDGVMRLLLNIRKGAKEKKDFATADQIRNALNDLNIIIKDGKEGSSWEMN